MLNEIVRKDYETAFRAAGELTPCCIVRILRECAVILLAVYTLPRKKRKFNFLIFYGDPGPGSVTPVMSAKGNAHRPTLLPKRKATSEKLHFFWGRVYVKATSPHVKLGSSDCMVLRV